MNYPSYVFHSNEDPTQFFFESIGPKGIIQKSVILTPTEENNIFNLGLVDVDSISGELSDMVVTDNGDTNKILATIFQIIWQYTGRNPTHWIIFAGNSSARNRLYRMAINHALNEIYKSFSLLGFTGDNWETFEPTKTYQIYLVIRK